MPDKRFIPIAKTDVESVSPGASTDILASDIEPSYPPSLFRIMVSVDAACLFSAEIYVAASETTYTVYFNSKSDLTADALYMFDMLVHSGDTVNFQIDSAETVHLLRVQEILYGG